VGRTLWARLYLAVASTAYPGPAAGVTHPDRRVVVVYLWAAGHRRPTAWACDPRHWEPWARPPARLPSQPTMSRRPRAAPVGRLPAALCRRFRGDPRAGWVKWVDGFPLPVGNYSHDPGATTGYGAGGFYRGYKPHAAWGAAPAPLALEARPAHQAESCLARVLVRRRGGGRYLVGDSGLDSNPPRRTATARGHQVVAPPKKRGRGLGHHRQEPGRRRSRDLLAGAFGRAVYAARSGTERWFSRLEGVGLGRLPGWVRRRVQAHLLILATQATIGQPPPPG